MNVVILEAPIIEPPVREGDVAMAVLTVVVEVALVLEPCREEVELPVVSGLGGLGLEFVVQYSLAMELVILPLPLVG